MAQKVDNIFNAVVLLGSTEISRIVIEERMNKSGIKPFRSEWLHAYITSTIAAYLSNSIGMAPHAGTLITMAMMHDIGKKHTIQESYSTGKRRHAQGPKRQAQVRDRIVRG